MAIETIIDEKDDTGRRICVTRDGKKLGGSITFANGQVTSVLVENPQQHDYTDKNGDPDSDCNVCGAFGPHEPPGPCPGPLTTPTTTERVSEQEKEEYRCEWEIAHSTGVCTCDGQQICPTCVINLYADRAEQAEDENVNLRRQLHASQAMMRWIRAIMGAPDGASLIPLIRRETEALRELRAYKMRTETRLIQMGVEMDEAVPYNPDPNRDLTEPEQIAKWVKKCLRELLEEKGT